ncbi:MAG: CHC2 zinc finger domain-containing protein [Armatimonadota bacterium]
MSWYKFKEQVRDANPLDEVCRDHGIELSAPPTGAATALCPYHNESSASWHVYPDQHSYCYGCHHSGDVFDLVQHLHHCDFMAALQYLADRAGIPVPQWTPEQRVEHERGMTERRRMEDVWGMAVRHWHEALPDHVRENWYHKRYGFSDHSIGALQLGFADGYLVHTLMQQGVSSDELLLAGLAVSIGGQLKDRWVGRLIFPYWAGGRVVYLAARQTEHTPDQPWEQGKYRKLPVHHPDSHPEISRTVSNEYFYGEDHARGADEIIITEGIADCIAANQAGFRCLSPGTTKFRADDAPKLLRLSRCANRLYVCNDAEESGQGEAGALAIAEQLYVAGVNVRIVELPRAKGVTKIDLCDFLRDNGADALRPLLDDAQDPVEYAARRLPKDAHERQSKIREIMDLIVIKDAVVRDDYRTRLPRLLGLSKGTFSEALKEAAQRRRASAEQQAPVEAGTDAAPVWREDDPPDICFAQDFHRGLAHYAVLVPDAQGKLQPRVVCSDRSAFGLHSRQAIDYFGRAPEPHEVPYEANWSTGTMVPNSVPAFLAGNARVDPLALLRETRELLEEFLVFPDPRYHLLLAVWAMGTYVYQMFDAYPYLALSGPKGAGKTRTLELLEAICFNSGMAASVSDAVIFRKTTANRGTMLIDEAESLASKRKDDHSERLQIYNSGYRRSGRVERCVGDDHVPTTFATYCPRVFANIAGLENVLGSRTIQLSTTRTNIKIPKFTEREQRERMRDLRNGCYVFALGHHDQIAQVLDQLPALGYLRDRDDELWAPLLAITEFLDGLRLEDDPMLTDEQLLTSTMRSLARDLTEERLAEDDAMDPVRRVIQAIRDILNAGACSPVSKSGHDDGTFYIAREVLELVFKDTGIDWLKQPTLTRYLRQAGIIAGKGDQPRLRLDGCRTQVACYRLDPHIVENAAVRFGVAGEAPPAEGAG